MNIENKVLHYYISSLSQLIKLYLTIKEFHASNNRLNLRWIALFDSIYWVVLTENTNPFLVQSSSPSLIYIWCLVLYMGLTYILISS